LGSVWDIDITDWRQLFEVNYWGVVHGIQEFVPILVHQGSGHVVTTASMSGLSTVPGMADYASAKHAIIALSEILRADLDMAGASAIGVTILCPAVVRTAMGDRAVNLFSNSKSTSDRGVIGSGPNLANVLEPSDVADAAIK